MIPFAECPACLKRPRARIGGSDLIAHDGSAAGKITDGLIDTGRDTVLIYHCYQCPACGTYYRFESVDIGITRLFRITIAEADAIFACTAESPARRKHESAAIAKNYDAAIQQMQAGLSQASAVVREYAAETLADEYKKHRNSRALRGLFRHNDPAVLMGVLHSFSERPYQGYSFECPNGFRNKHYATCKPFIEPLRFLREFAELCCDSDARIRRFVFCMLGNSYITDDKMVPALRRVAAARRTAEHKELLIGRLWASHERDRKELVHYLCDADAAIRNKALSRMRELSRERYNILQGTIELFLADIRVLPQGQWSDELRAYLKDPAGPEPEDDPWD